MVIPMKKTIALILAAAIAFCLCSCAKKAGVGAMLDSNIARVYTPSDRISRFFLNGTELDGTVTGKAYFDAAADGRTALAWVDTVLYFVSEKGVDNLGTGISIAEISYDGSFALYQMGNELCMYSVETRESKTVDSGISAVIQFAFSPSGETVMYTAAYEDAPEEYRTMMLRGGSVSPALEGRPVVALAVSNDADIVYTFNYAEGTFCADVNGETRVISKECGASSNYNFTEDLDEVIFSTDEGAWSQQTEREIFYRLSDGATAELGRGFGYSLKTDVYSISKVNMFTYINAVDSFLDGMFMLRTSVEGGYLYSVGYIDEKCAVRSLVTGALKYEVVPDGSGVIWLGVGGLTRTDLNGKSTRIADSAADFAVDGNTVYYVTAAGELFRIKGGRAEKLDSSVSSIGAFNGACVYIRNYSDGTGTFCAYTDGGISEIAGNAVRFDRRCGQLLVYTDPVSVGSKDVYTLLLSSDGREFKKAAEGVDP